MVLAVSRALSVPICCQQTRSYLEHSMVRGMGCEYLPHVVDRGRGGVWGLHLASAGCPIPSAGLSKAADCVEETEERVGGTRGVSLELGEDGHERAGIAVLGPCATGGIVTSSSHTTCALAPVACIAASIFAAKLSTLISSHACPWAWVRVSSERLGLGRAEGGGGCNTRTGALQRFCRRGWCNLPWNIWWSQGVPCFLSPSHASVRFNVQFFVSVVEDVISLKGWLRSVRTLACEAYPPAAKLSSVAIEAPSIRQAAEKGSGRNQHHQN